MTTQLPTEMGGGNGKVAIIDTEGTFRYVRLVLTCTTNHSPNRLRTIAERFGIDADAVLENIVFARAFNTDHQLDLITELAARFAEERGVYRLLVCSTL